MKTKENVSKFGILLSMWCDRARILFLSDLVRQGISREASDSSRLIRRGVAKQYHTKSLVETQFTDQAPTSR